jgi:hypothetical protein
MAHKTITDSGQQRICLLVNHVFSTIDSFASGNLAFKGAAGLTVAPCSFSAHFF